MRSGSEETASGGCPSPGDENEKRSQIMNAINRRATLAPRIPKGRLRIDDAVVSGATDSPHATYLRRWLGLQAVRHRELLLNIEAASRINRGVVSASSR
jgi:hypothetical protein